jgi:PhnB protein
MNERQTAASLTLEPFLNVSNGPDAIAFYKAAFGAEVVFLIPPETGSTIAQMSISGETFWLADESPDHQNPSPATLKGSTVRLVLTVDDPDAVFERAVAAGATVLWPMEDQDYGWRMGRVVDPFGHHWEIGKPLAP